MKTATVTMYGVAISPIETFMVRTRLTFCAIRSKSANDLNRVAPDASSLSSVSKSFVGIGISISWIGFGTAGEVSGDGSSVLSILTCRCYFVELHHTSRACMLSLIIIATPASVPFVWEASFDLVAQFDNLNLLLYVTAVYIIYNEMRERIIFFWEISIHDIHVLCTEWERVCVLPTVVHACHVCVVHMCAHM